jgi:hypothetical protein
MKYRKLRIAWSVAWAIAATLLIALWVRSYDSPGDWPSHLLFESGNFTVSTIHGCSVWVKDQLLQPHHIPTGFEYAYVGLQSWNLYLPFWFPVAIASISLAAPWWRILPMAFSIRTLLIATTLIAILLGLIVWLR